MTDYYNSKSERKPTKLPTVISEEDFSKLLKATNTPTHKLAFKLAFLCGLRISEIIKLQPEDFDKERRLIFIRQGKGGKDRYVPYPIKFISDKEVRLIPLYYKSVTSGSRSLEISFKDKCKTALGRTDLHFHNLRHSFATNLLSKGIPVTEVQFWLGHSRLQTTSIYLKVSPDSALKRYEEMYN